MSASLIVLIPMVLVGLVTALCFVGCALQTGGIVISNGPYQDAITSDLNLVAFWPLDDQPPPDNSIPVAHDIASHPVGQNPFDGKYKGSFMLRQQPGIVPLDTQNNARTPCASFPSGRVEVDFHAELNAAPFTLECWVQPSWLAGDTNIHSVVVTSDLDMMANTGYALYCDSTNKWGASFGDGPAPGPGFVLTTPAAGSPAVMPGTGTVFYLALTFDGISAVNLFVTPVGSPFNMAPYATATLPQKFVSSVSPLQFFIGMGRPDLPTSMLLPFIGKIQDVAFYKVPLSAPQLQGHFNQGANPG
jgi:hypothetical protein